MNHLLSRVALLAGLCAATSAWAQAQSREGPREVTVKGARYTLVDRQGKCGVQRESGEVLPLAIDWPCGFGTDREGRARVEKFNAKTRTKSLEAAPIVLVQHFQPQAQPQPEPRVDCIAYSQALRWNGDEVEANEHVGKSASCHSGAHDQKAYTGVFDW
ncbi:hypothetical protein [Bordetella genomosp. 13]|uniref:hypothetical protein n=1 Tax=Bordetella genomosp. 13 TaxID=463040 RepID=UPI0011A9E390|nr:hypothetical protein [Bordetella genomosp. 13]